MFVIRVFVKMRETLLGTRELAKKLASLEKKLTGRLDSHEAAIVHVLQDASCAVWSRLVYDKSSDAVPKC